MDILIKKHQRYFQHPGFIGSLLSACLLLTISVCVNYYAGLYATLSVSSSVTDLILSNIPTYDVSGMFVYGAVLFWVFVLVICIFEPKKIPFTFKAIALFIVIRSLFIILTHIGPFPTQIIPASNMIDWFSFGGDLFFSGHVGLPFLLALVFWDTAILRCVFIASSILFSAVVLLGHIHYSIDVLSAFFITYTIFHLATVFFEKDLKIFGHNFNL